MYKYNTYGIHKLQASYHCLSHIKYYKDYDPDIFDSASGGDGMGGGEARDEAIVGTYIHVVSSGGGGERASMYRKNA
jgi:hypothetical protein